MVNGDYIDLARLNLDELNGVVNLYPWFGLARKELCHRTKQPSLEGSVFQSEDMVVTAAYHFQHFCVKRFYETEVIDSDFPFEGGGRTTWFEGSYSEYHEALAKRK